MEDENLKFVLLIQGTGTMGITFNGIDLQNLNFSSILRILKPIHHKNLKIIGLSNFELLLHHFTSI